MIFLFFLGSLEELVEEDESFRSSIFPNQLGLKNLLFMHLLSYPPTFLALGPNSILNC